MADKEEEYPLGMPQEHALMCDKHKSMPIDVICEDCEEFICSKCVKENHKDHDWNTIQTAVTLKSRGLMKSMKEIEEKNIQQMDEKIHSTSKQMAENKIRCEIEVLSLQKHYDAMVEKLNKIKEKQEKILRDSLKGKNAEVSKARSSLEEKKKNVLQLVKSLKENSRTMTDIIWLKTHRELTKLLSTEDDYKEISKYLLRYESGDINEAQLESMMGETFDTDQISVTETNSFQSGDEPIVVLEAINADTCLLINYDTKHVEQVDRGGNKEKQFSVTVYDVCVTDNNEVYVTDWMNKAISRLSPSGSVSTVFSTDPLSPVGICQTMNGNLLVTLIDIESDRYQPNSQSRRLVRHVTLTGDVIREYEYQEDGQTRLFTVPLSITQNNNTDVCVINRTSASTGELVILSFSGSLKSVYPEQDQGEKYYLYDVVCDSHCNIIVTELESSTIHVLSPEGRFMRYLLTENQVKHPFAMSLRNSTLWIGDFHGLVSVSVQTMNQCAVIHVILTITSFKEIKVLFCNKAIWTLFCFMRFKNRFKTGKNCFQMALSTICNIY